MPGVVRTHRQLVHQQVPGGDISRRFARCQFDLPINQADEVVVATFDEFLELLFQVCLTICTETFIDGRPDSTLLVYFSGILGFSGDCRQFLLAKQYCSRSATTTTTTTVCRDRLSLTENPYPGPCPCRSPTLLFAAMPSQPIT